MKSVVKSRPAGLREAVRFGALLAAPPATASAYRLDFPGIKKNDRAEKSSRPWARRPAVWVLLGLPPLLTALCLWGAIQLGPWLVVEDPLEPAHAVVVLGGQLPFRALEAARLYRQGLAPEIWLTHGERAAEQRALDKLGIVYTREETYSREVLLRMGVPGKVIRRLEPPARNTAEEVLLIARELERAGARRVILVTSKPHTRRVKATWRALVRGAAEVEVRSTTDDPYNPARWWANTEDALAVSRECFGLLNVWAGFPVRPDRD